ncbi:MAG: alpha/beta fold hydrolase, partial [Pseudomonadota bacterium]
MTITFDQWRSVHPAFDHKGLSQTYVDTGNVEGENRPVILLFHGYPTWSYDWVDVIGPLSVGHRIIAADWIGYGLSDKPSRHVRVDEQINRLVALLDHLGVEDFHLVAHDYGSTCAQEMLDRPDIAARTKTLTLMNGGVIFSAYKPTQTQKLLISPLGSLVSRFLSKDRIKTKLDALRDVGLLKAVLMTHPLPKIIKLDAFHGLAAQRIKLGFDP